MGYHILCGEDVGIFCSICSICVFGLLRFYSILLFCINSWRPSVFFVLLYFLCFLHFLRFFVQKWLRVVKNYLHAKFRASSSKIERVMINFVLPPPAPPPVTNLPVELCASRQLKMLFYHTKMKIKIK